MLKITPPATFPPEVTDFLNRPLPKTLDFFIAPPPEVGKLQAAWSEVKIGQSLWPLWFKLSLAVLLVGIGLCGFIWVQYHSPPGKRAQMGPLILLLASISIPPVAVFVAVKSKVIAYLGEEGVAIYSTRGSRESTTGRAVRFTELADLKLAKTGQSKQSRDWRLDFVGLDEQVVLRLRGKATIIAGKALPQPRYLIAAAMYASWQLWVSRRNNMPFHPITALDVLR